MHAAMQPCTPTALTLKGERRGGLISNLTLRNAKSLHLLLVKCHDSIYLAGQARLEGTKGTGQSTAIGEGVVRYEIRRCCSLSLGHGSVRVHDQEGATGEEDGLGDDRCHKGSAECRSCMNTC